MSLIDAEVKTTVTVGNSAPFSVIVEPRKGHTAQFWIDHRGNGPLDASWIPSLINQLREAERMAEMLDDSPASIDKPMKPKRVRP